MIDFMLNDKRIRIIVGHYGSGKTEFTINYAVQLAAVSSNVAIADLDIVNVYFRSREKADLLAQKGIKVISSSLGHITTLDIPALSAGIAAPLQDDTCDVVLDVGGDAVGARVLARFKSEIEKREYDMFCVLNAYREQTQTAEGAIEHIKAIEATTGLTVTGIINNTHLLKETKIKDVMQGQELAESVSQKLDIPVKYTAVLKNLVDQLPKDLQGQIFPISLYMREDWM